MNLLLTWIFHGAKVNKLWMSYEMWKINGWHTYRASTKRETKQVVVVLLLGWGGHFLECWWLIMVGYGEEEDRRWGGKRWEAYLCCRSTPCLHSSSSQAQSRRQSSPPWRTPLWPPARSPRRHTLLPPPPGHRPEDLWGRKTEQWGEEPGEEKDKKKKKYPLNEHCKFVKGSENHLNTVSVVDLLKLPCLNQRSLQRAELGSEVKFKRRMKYLWNEMPSMSYESHWI